VEGGEVDWDPTWEPLIKLGVLPGVRYIGVGGHLQGGRWGCRSRNRMLGACWLLLRLYWLGTLNAPGKSHTKKGKIDILHARKNKISKGKHGKAKEKMGGGGDVGMVWY